MVDVMSFQYDMILFRCGCFQSIELPSNVGVAYESSSRVGMLQQDCEYLGLGRPSNCDLWHWHWHWLFWNDGSPNLPGFVIRIESQV